MKPLIAKLDKHHLDQVESDIRPCMGTAITIPVESAEHRGVSIYVSRSGFLDDPTPEDLEFMQRVAKNLELVCHLCHGVLIRNAAPCPECGGMWRE